MLAKVIKKMPAESFMPFLIPELGEAKTAHGEVGKFVFPGVSEIVPLPAQAFAGNAPDESIEDILESARSEAALILAQAQEQSENIRQAALEKGSIEARADLETEIARRVDEQVSALREDLVSSIEKISSLQSDLTSKIETELVGFAIEIAKKIVGREVSIDREVALTLVKISLARLHSRTFATVHLNSQDFSFVQAHRERLNFHGSLELVEDNSIGPGGCLIRTETGDIDARIESQFDEISQGLLNS